MRQSWRIKKDIAKNDDIKIFYRTTFIHEDQSKTLFGCLTYVLIYQLSYDLYDISGKLSKHNVSFHKFRDN